MSDFKTDVERVENMLNICGCSNEKVKEVLEECLRRNKNKVREVKK